MRALQSLAAALSAASVALLTCTLGTLAAKAYTRNAASPSYRSSDVCPERCETSGPNTGNWSTYPSLDKIAKCHDTMFYSFSLYDPIDEGGLNHRIHACSSSGPDFGSLPVNETVWTASTAAESLDVKLEMGWFKEGFGLAKAGIRSIIKQLRAYVQGGHGNAEGKPFMLYGKTGAATVGVYIGPGLLNQGLAQDALRIFQDNLLSLNVSAPSMAMQLCGPEYGASHTFGVIATSGATFAPPQEAMQSWANGICLEFAGSTTFTGTVELAAPLQPIGTAVAASRRRRSHSHHQSARSGDLHRRAECTTVQAVFGDDCDSLAAKCGLTYAEFVEINDEKDFCINLKPKQHACCDEGDLPDFSPSPNEDGSCFSNTVTGDNNCDSLAAEYSLTMDELKEYNKNTWGFSGCDPLFEHSIICLSEGSPPFPAPIANAICPPGTAEKGTYGCISNCGIDIKQGDGTGAITIGYYQGYCLSRDCLYQDPLQIDTSKYTHLHFGRILSFGGWAFSTEADTYMILRNGVKPENRLTMATKIADSIKEHNLDGVGIDWEYPGAPDLPTFDPGTEEDGPNYLAFLVVPKNLLPGKSVAIAAPASYWYLKQFPIEQTSKIVDYIVYMTYDLHGQWDAHNSNSQEGCETGNCLHSQAGVPGTKVVVGVTSYGRSFKMAQAGCDGPGCTFTGDRLNSNAMKGRCTGTAGYIADAEIAEILEDSSRVTRHFVDSSSHSDILVYDETEWVGYMSSSTKSARTALYKDWGLGGTSDWASDLQAFHATPKPNPNWLSLKTKVAADLGPFVDETRNGNWTDFDCDHDYVKYSMRVYPDQRWRELGCEAAWEDMVRIYKDVNKPQRNMTWWESFVDTFHIGKGANCGQITQDSCIKPPTGCHDGANSDTSGPAAYLIYNSLASIHMMYKDYYDALTVATTQSVFELDLMEDTFAPIPPPEDNEWKLLLIDLITLGTLGTTAPLFNSVLRRAPWFRVGNRLDNGRDTTMTLIGQSTTISKDVLPSSEEYWTPQHQNNFTGYLGNVIGMWQNMSTIALDQLFDGKDKNLQILHETITGGKLIEGKSDLPAEGDEDTDQNNLVANIKKIFYGYSIPALWKESKAHVFILEAGHFCEDGPKMGDYISDDNMELTGACVKDYQYYLVYPKGDAGSCYEDCNTEGYCEMICNESKFSAPPGIDALGSGSFGGIKVSDLVIGAVETWLDNEKENIAQPGDGDAKDQLTIDKLLNVDITVPGYVRIPVCKADRAYQSWDTANPDSSENWPCDLPPGINECDDSTFEDETSDASPLVEDCLQIIKNIEEDGSTDFTMQVAGMPHRQILQHATCAFGVEATKQDGNVNFKVGGQDVINIINDAVNKFGGKKIGAKGEMKCNGNMHDQDVMWGIYHD
ncbi:chitinase [Aspergillus venezuelensis]